MRLLLAAIIFLALSIAPAHAQAFELDKLMQGAEPGVAGQIVRTAALLTILSLAPGLMVMVTSFTRLVIAFSFLRSGLGLQSTPANLILIVLSIFLTAFIMAPVFDKAYRDGLQPLQDGKIAEGEALEKIADPFRAFMLANVREKDLALFSELSGATAPLAPTAKVELRILVPAFMTSELRRGFEIGFLIALPFLIIDLVVATLTMSMGMMMLPPTAISLPFKVLFFVLIDGWNLLVGSLVRSFS
jgi:flagellar biosynthetic protein FliP